MYLTVIAALSSNLLLDPTGHVKALASYLVEHSTIYTMVVDSSETLLLFGSTSDKKLLTMMLRLAVHALLSSYFHVRLATALKTIEGLDLSSTTCLLRQTCCCLIILYCLIVA